MARVSPFGFIRHNSGGARHQQKGAYNMNVSQALKIYFVMGSVNCFTFDPEKTLSEAIKGGITMFQYREKGKGALAGEEQVYLGKKLKMLCERNRIPFIVNDDIDLALELNADGIHIGQDDSDPFYTRKRVGATKWIGISTHSIQEAKKAVADGADYIGVGPMFSTKTKQDAHDVVGPSLITQIREAGFIHLPIVGIGGITLENASDVYQSGANGVAIISAISQAKSPKDATQAFCSIQ